jgi:hypothetical protein
LTAFVSTLPFTDNPGFGLNAPFDQPSMHAFSRGMREARMLAARHWFAAGTALLLLAGPASRGAQAQDAKLVADCSVPATTVQSEAPATPPADPPRGATTVSCDVRATDAVVFKSVKATVKGRTEPLATHYTAFDPRNQALVAMFLIQIMEPGRRGSTIDIAEAVVKLAEARDGKRRYAAYTIGNDLNLIADFAVSKADFDRQVRAIRNVRLRTQLFKTALEAIAKLAKEKGDRKALIILGDGTFDDPAAGYNHEQVVKAAKDANVVIHALGYIADTADLPKFQILRRLADDTGGFRREVKVGAAQRYAIGSPFVGEVLENGGAVTIPLKEPPGPATLSLTADFTNGRFASAEQSITVPSPPAVAAPPSNPTSMPTPPVSEPAAWHRRLGTWAQNNVAVALAIGVAFGLGMVGVALFAFSNAPKGSGTALTDKQGRPVVYGWLEMLDSNASRYPLRTTNVRIGRHRDNDICLQNDSISRRHAVLHFNSDNRRFVITDLGGGNGVVVNKIKQPSHELSDGDMVELGEVRLRFRANMEFLG